MQRARQRLLTWPLLGGLAVVIVLVAASLMVGVYDVWGAPDGGEMFLITRVPRTVALVLAGAGSGEHSARACRPQGRDNCRPYAPADQLSRIPSRLRAPR